MHRFGFATAVALCVTVAFAGSASGAQELVKGPGGAKFYTPPKDLPKGHGSLIWQRKAKGLMPIDGREVEHARPLHLEDAAGQDDRGLRRRQRPQGQAAEGRLAGGLLRARDHG